MMTCSTTLQKSFVFITFENSYMTFQTQMFNLALSCFFLFFFVCSTVASRINCTLL